MASIKTRLRVLRAEREWSQAKLAVVVGVTRQTINSIEKGRYHPNPRLAFKTCQRSSESVFFRTLAGWVFCPLIFFPAKGCILWRRYSM